MFVLATLHQLDPSAFPAGENQVSVLVLCHTRELAFQIAHEYERFSKYLPEVKTAVFYGGVAIKTNRDVLKNDCPHIVVGTPGRMEDLLNSSYLVLNQCSYIVLDEADRMFEMGFENQVRKIFEKLGF